MEKTRRGYEIPDGEAVLPNVELLCLLPSVYSASFSSMSNIDTERLCRSIYFPLGSKWTTIICLGPFIVSILTFHAMRKADPSGKYYKISMKFTNAAYTSALLNPFQYLRQHTIRRDLLVVAISMNCDDDDRI